MYFNNYYFVFIIIYNYKSLLFQRIVCVLVGSLLIALIFCMLFFFCKPFNRKSKYLLYYYIQNERKDYLLIIIILKNLVKSIFSSREKPLRFSDAISSTETSIDTVSSHNIHSTQQIIHPPSDITSLGII